MPIMRVPSILQLPALSLSLLASPLNSHCLAIDSLLPRAILSPFPLLVLNNHPDDPLMHVTPSHAKNTLSLLVLLLR